MFDQLMDMLRQNGAESVINNAAVPNEHNEGVLQEAQGSILSVIKGMMANGQSEELRQLANDPSHPATQQMQSGFMDGIMKKFGISGAAAQSIASSLIPMVLSSLSNKQNNTGGTGGGLDIGSLLGSLGKSGLDKDGDGDVDLKDVTKMFGL